MLAVVFKCITCSTFDDVTDDVILRIVSGPTPNKALFKELVAPPGDFSLMVPVCSQVI